MLWARPLHPQTLPPPTFAGDSPKADAQDRQILRRCRGLPLDTLLPETIDQHSELAERFLSDIRERIPRRESLGEACMNRPALRRALTASFGIALTAAVGGCSVARDASNNFDIGTSTAPHADATPQQSVTKGQLLVASDSLGDQVFKDRSNDTAFASAPTE